MTTTRPRIQEVIDLDRYPLKRLDSTEGRALLDSCWAELRASGACQLPGLFRPAAVARLVAEATTMREEAFTTNRSHNVYLEAFDEDVSEGDPRGMRQHSSKKTLAWDFIDEASPLRTAYEWDGLTEFIARAMELESLYRYADPLGAASLAIFEDTDELGWHFDRSPLAVTVMLQPALEGGQYQYFHNLRTHGNENEAEIAEKILGSTDGLLNLDSEPGTLSMFRGRNSMHRVTSVTGNRPRINAVLAYSEEPDDKMNAHTQRLFYGRST